MNQAIVLFLVAVFGTIFLVEAQSKPEIFANVGGNNKQQQGTVGLRYPSGTQGQINYGHARGYGHDVGVDASVPLWSRTRGRTESRLNLGGGATHHFGGPGGNRFTDKRIGLTFTHRF
ncbi:hypothetical protein ABEB36_013076 [Hypothenemus hampei]|uniref:Attacin C-terminal domain-containing protein n=1 Tax=Hypothenemus hampei TaxID=57062 RepID=A0ABD1E8U0_HYPHA